MDINNSQTQLIGTLRGKERGRKSPCVRGLTVAAFSKDTKKRKEHITEISCSTNLPTYNVNLVTRLSPTRGPERTLGTRLHTVDLRCRVVLFYNEYISQSPCCILYQSHCFYNLKECSASVTCIYPLTCSFLFLVWTNFGEDVHNFKTLQKCRLLSIPSLKESFAHHSLKPPLNLPTPLPSEAIRARD